MSAVYALCDPGTGEVRYVGQTTLELQHRLKLHTSTQVLRNGRSYCARWVQGLAKQGLRPTILELERVYGDRDFLDAAEESWIAYGRRLKLRLTNLLPGGGGYHLPRSEEFKRKQRKPKSAEQVANMRLASKSRYADPVKRDRHNQAMKRPEVRAKLSASGKKAWASGAFSDRAPRGMAVTQGGGQLGPKELI